MYWIRYAFGIAVANQVRPFSCRGLQVILLFRALSSKDVFEEHYKDKTAKRLLGGKIISEDIEKMMISKLKQECGTNYTNKLEGMFVDLSKSAKFMESFKTDQSAALAGLPVDLDATVLTSAHWEGRGIVASPLPRCFPPAVQSVADQFHKYYLEKHSGRRLAWNYTKGTADIRSKFSFASGKPVTYEITVSTYQMVVLMAFNEHDSISYRLVR
jgi:cullin 3